MCIFQRHQPTWDKLKDHSKMTYMEETRTFFRALQMGMNVNRSMDSYWNPKDDGYNTRMLLVMFRLSLFNAEDI